MSANVGVLIKGQRGFTLIELMVTVVVLGIVMAVAIPSFNNQIARNSADGLAQDLLAALNFTRSEAVKRGALVSLCASTDGATCSNNAGDWTQGFMVFVDRATAAAATPELGPNPVVLRVWPKQHSKAEIQILQALPGTIKMAFVRYTNLGTLAPAMPAGGLRVRIKMKEQGDGLNCVSNSAQQFALSAAGIMRLDNTNCWN